MLVAATRLTTSSCKGFMTELNSNDNFTVTVKHAGQEYVVDCLTTADTVADLKGFLFSLTNVEPHNQKLMGLTLKKGALSDNTTLAEVTVPNNKKIMMMGTSSDVISRIQDGPSELPEVFDDVDFQERELAICQRPEYLQKVQKRIENYKITVLNPPRSDKRLLVLDIDYTIYDHRSNAESVRELMRPHLHEFLCKVYPHYEIAIWSATSMKWIQAKTMEMGLLSQAAVSLPGDSSTMNISGSNADSSSSFQLCLLLDSSAMISVYLPGVGLKDVKPLQVIWGQFPQWNACNTIMFDDIRRNFLMNPQSGLKIEPYRNCHQNRDSDRVLLQLSEYLNLIARNEKDFSGLNHRKWKKYVMNNPQSSRNKKFSQIKKAPSDEGN